MLILYQLLLLRAQSYSSSFGSDAYRTFHFWHFRWRLWNPIYVERSSSFKVAKGIVQPKLINDGRSFAECYVVLF